MDKRNENNFKSIAIAGILASALIISGKQIYSHYFPTKEEQAQQAALKLQEAFKEKMQDELIKAAERLEKEKQLKEIEPEIKQQEKIETQNQEVKVKNEQNIGSNSVAQKDVYNNNEKDNSENSDAVTAFGVTIGKTTEEEIRRKFSVIDEEKGEINSIPHKMLILNVNKFSSTELPVEFVDIILNPQGIVESFKIEFSGQHFQKLHKTLIQKYALEYKEDPFVGDHRAGYRKNNVKIFLKQPHIGGFKTVLTYVDEDFANLCELERKKKEEQEKQRMMNQF